MRKSLGKQIALIAVLTPLSLGACAASSVNEILIHPDAQDVQRHSFDESKSYQISYSMNLKYPATTLTDAHFARLKKLGWSRCSGYREGWESHVDASKGEGHERSVFQNVSYWSKGSTLLTVLMRYDAGVTKDNRSLDVPDNMQQNVILIQDSNPDTKEWLKLTCPERGR
jgi:hypothetical protein